MVFYGSNPSWRRLTFWRWRWNIFRTSRPPNSTVSRHLLLDFRRSKAELPILISIIFTFEFIFNVLETVFGQVFHKGQHDVYYLLFNISKTTTRRCYNPSFAPCPPNPTPSSHRLHFGSPAEIQHRLHPVHARGAQHAPHMRVDGQDPGLAAPKPPAQIPAKVHWGAPPSGHAEAWHPGCGRVSQEAPGHSP